MRYIPRVVYFPLISFGLIFLSISLSAQGLLDKKISVTANGQSVQQVLTSISKKGNFYFSYNSNLIPRDSIVSITATDKPLKDILDLLLGTTYSYKETGNYVIIGKYVANGKPFIISGYVVDKHTGEKIPNASVYETRQLVTTLTNDQGYFQLRMHNRFPDVMIGVSKASYIDTIYPLRSGYDQVTTLTLSPIRTITLKPVTITPYGKLGNTWYGKFFFSSKQKVRDINLNQFFVKQPFQFSLWPGTGTHGKLGAQVVNKASINLLGGYSAGVKGVEFGGVFNIDKHDVQYVQVAGVFNVVGGQVKGVQVAGLINSVIDSVEGIQIAGISNAAREAVNGMQVSGIFNKAKKVRGMQIAGLGNISQSSVDGVQVAGVFNYAKHLTGLQIGLVNIADTSSGVSLGLINIIKKNGYANLSLFWNEALDINIALKTGNRKLYNILLAGTTVKDKQRAFSFGYGIGRDFRISNGLSFTTEIAEQSIYTRGSNNIPLLLRIQPALQVHLSRKISLFAGPAFSVYFPGSSSTNDDPLSPPVHRITLWRSVTGWFGGQAGISFL